MNSSTSCILSRSILKYGKVEHLHVETACLTVIFKTLGLIRLRRILSYRQISNPYLQTAWLTIRAWLQETGFRTGKLCRGGDFYPGITWTEPTRSSHFYIEIGSNAHEQCDIRCPVSRLVYLSGCPASVIARKISSRDPGITILGSQLTGLAQLSCNRRVDFCCVYN